MSERATATVKAPEAKAARTNPQTCRRDIRALPTPFREQIGSLQKSIGNRGVAQLYRPGFLQAKLTIGQANDIYEQEADRVADQVMRMPEPAIQAKPG